MKKNKKKYTESVSLAMQKVKSKSSSIQNGSIFKAQQKVQNLLQEDMTYF